MASSKKIPHGQEIAVDGLDGFSLALLELGESLTSICDIQDTIKLAVVKAVEVIDAADAGIVCLYDEKQGKLSAKAAFGYGQEILQISAGPDSGGAPGVVFKTRQSTLWSSPEEVRGLVTSLEDEGQHHLREARKELKRPISVVCSPLLVRGRFIGCIQLEHCRDHRPFKMRDLALLQSLAEETALALDNITLLQELQRREMVWVEMLTGLLYAKEYEHKRMVMVLEAEISQVLDMLNNLESTGDKPVRGFAQQHQGLRAIKASVQHMLGELHRLSSREGPTPSDNHFQRSALVRYVRQLRHQASYLQRIEEMGEQESSSSLTPREREIIKLIAEGRTNKEIANLLFISIQTVQSHRANIMEKLRMHDRTELVRYAIRKGLVTP